MKKLESTWYNMVIVLTVIALIAGVALASVTWLPVRFGCRHHLGSTTSTVSRSTFLERLVGTVHAAQESAAGVSYHKRQCRAGY